MKYSMMTSNLLPALQPPSARHSSASCGPAARWMQPSTPPPPSSDSLAAFTMASTGTFVISLRTISKGIASHPKLHCGIPTGGRGGSNKTAAPRQCTPWLHFTQGHWQKLKDPWGNYLRRDALCTSSSKLSTRMNSKLSEADPEIISPPDGLMDP